MNVQRNIFAGILIFLVFLMVPVYLDFIGINQDGVEDVVQDDNKINSLIAKHKTNFKGVGQPLRIALTGSKFGPGIYDIILSLNENEIVKRLKMI